MKKWLPALLLILIFLVSFQLANGQCSICTKTAQQLGEKPAKGLNAGIIYLAIIPFIIAGYLAYRWRKSNREA